MHIKISKHVFLFAFLFIVAQLIVLNVDAEVVADSVDGLKSIATGTTTSLSSVKTLVDETAAVTNALANDSVFAESVFKAVAANNSAALLTLIKQKAPRSDVKVLTLESDFKFVLSFGEVGGKNSFYLCLAGPRHPTKCHDGTNADLAVHFE